MSTLLAIHGIRGGVGVSSLVAGLGHALQAHQQRVLVVDMNPDNLLGLHFNLPFDTPAGWGQALLAGADWRDYAFELGSALTLVPYGRVDAAGAAAVECELAVHPTFWRERIEAIAANFDWLLFDLPQRFPAHAAAIWQHAHCQLRLQLATVDSGCHALMQRPELRAIDGGRLLVNRYDPSARLQRDLMQVWLRQYEQSLVPQPVHEDANVPEALAMKSPLGRHAPDALAAADLDSLAVWCLAQTHRPSGGERP